jgi:hypothetical protein
MVDIRQRSRFPAQKPPSMLMSTQNYVIVDVIPGLGAPTRCFAGQSHCRYLIEWQSPGRENLCQKGCKLQDVSFPAAQQ